MARDFLNYHILPIESVFLSYYDTPGVEESILSNIRKSYFRFGGIRRKNETFNDVRTGDIITASYHMACGEPLRLDIRRGNSVTARSKKLKSGMYAVEFLNFDSSLKKTCVFTPEHNYLKVVYFSSDKANAELCELDFIYKNGEAVVKCSEGGKPSVAVNYFLFKPPFGFDAQMLANRAAVPLPLRLVCSENTEYYATQGDIDLMLAQAQAIRDSRSFKTKKYGFAFVPRDFSGKPEQNAARFDFEKAAQKASTAEDALSEVLSEKRHVFCREDKPVHQETKAPLGDNSDADKAIAAEEAPTSALNEKSDEDFCPTPESESPLSLSEHDNKPDCVINSSNEKYLYYGEIDENGDRTGIGRTMMKNGGLTYYGGYIADKRSGFGSYYYKSGKPCYFGNWKENKREGMGMGFRSVGGEIHAGLWHDDRPDGTGVRFDESGSIKYIADFHNGKKDGVCISFDGKGRLIITKWKNGEQLAEKKIIELNDL